MRAEKQKVMKFVNPLFDKLRSKW